MTVNQKTMTSTENVPRLELRQPRWATAFKLLKLALTLIILGAVVSSVDLSAAWEHIVHQNLPLAALAAIVLMLQVALGGTRWWVTLKCLGANPLLRDTMKLFYVSVFFNSYVWGGISGDLVRAWASYRSNVSVKTAITSVLLDRMAAIVAVACLVLLSATVFPSLVKTSPIMLVAILISAASLIGIVLTTQFRRMPDRWLKYHVLRILSELGSSIGVVFLRPSNVFPLVSIAILGQITLGIVAYLMAMSLNMSVSFLECLVFMQPVALVANLPISVGGWGVRETAMIALFGIIGVTASATLVLSVQLGLLSLIVALPGGVLWFSLKHDPPILPAAQSGGGSSTP